MVSLSGRSTRAAMKRRAFIGFAGWMTVNWPFALLAQQGDSKKRVGVLIARPENDTEGQSYLVAFQQALAPLGWRPGQNIDRHPDSIWGRLPPHQGRMDKRRRGESRQAPDRLRQIPAYIQDPYFVEPACRRARRRCGDPQVFAESCRARPWSISDRDRARRYHLRRAQG